MSSFNRCVQALLVLCVLSAGESTSRAEEAQAAIPKASVHFDGQAMRLAYATSNDAMTLAVLQQLTTKIEYEAAMQTVLRIEKKRALSISVPFSQELNPLTESAP
jgi:hypothetical protein